MEETIDALESEPVEEHQPVVKLPDVSDRVKAFFADNIVAIALMATFASVFGSMSSVADNARIFAFVFVLFIYDPIFTSLFGATPGHMIMGLIVRRQSNETKKIIFPLALLRYCLKLMLGWISLLTVTGSRKKRAIHDLVTGSVVLYKNPDQYK